MAESHKRMARQALKWLFKSFISLWTLCLIGIAVLAINMFMIPLVKDGLCTSNTILYLLYGPVFFILGGCSALFHWFLFPRMMRNVSIMFNKIAKKSL